MALVELRLPPPSPCSPLSSPRSPPVPSWRSGAGQTPAPRALVGNGTSPSEGEWSAMTG